MESITDTLDGRLVSCQGLPPKHTIFGQSEGMRGLWQIVERVAGASLPILILGEEGTGKEVLARFIHSCSPGTSAPFLKVSPPIPDGHAIDEVAFRVDHAVTDEEEDGDGDGNAARRLCTLFVEEVSDVGPSCQLELLQLIQGFRSFILSGGADIPVTLRVIGASTYDLEKEVGPGKFREDLFSFLSVVTLRLPPLRERKEDIPQLAGYFWQVYSERFGCHPDAPSPQLMDLLQQYDWPGNIRELENVMKRYVVLGEEGITGMACATPYPAEAASARSAHHAVSLKDVTREAAHALERKIILRTLQETQWNRRRTARALNISYRSLLYKIKEAGLLSEAPKTGAVEPARYGQKSDRNGA
ncbi:MAG TPA: sigma 54-interacting transcriptional regulator [Terriglobia bacterium]|nr:sigma 54-interacting transcriptional regulator [Terriglobia bacterium]